MNNINLSELQYAYKQKFFCLAISSPSGAGKSTICRQIIKSFDSFRLSISATTRNPRIGEQNGREYFFLKKDDFETKISQNHFIEHATVFNNLYGTPVDFVTSTLQSQNNVLFDIDYQGVEKINSYLRHTPAFEFVSVFILPPSIEELKNRLIKRGLDSQETINLRLEKAEFEISQSKSYDYVLINDNLTHCLNDLFSIINAEIIKRRSYFI